MLGNIIKSVGPNKYEVKFDNGVIKEVTSNSLRIEEADSGIPVEEAAPSLEAVSKESVENDDSNFSPDSEESDDILFLMDSARIDTFSDSDNESNDNSNDEIEINTGDINVPADTPDTNNNASTPNESSLTYHQKLETK